MTFSEMVTMLVVLVALLVIRLSKFSIHQAQNAPPIKVKALSIGALAAFVIIASPTSAAELFIDNFDATSNQTPNNQITHPGRQFGTLATLGYLQAGNVQIGNTTAYPANTPSVAGDDLLVAGGSAYVNYNFSNQTHPLEITFRGLVDSGNPDLNNWVSFSVGDNTVQWVNGATVSSILFRANGGTQLFDNGSPTVGALGFAPGLDAWTDYKIVLSDTAGTGSAWGTGGSRADYYVNGSFVGTMAISQLTASEGYIGFSSYGIVGYDDLKIQTVITPATNSWNTGDGIWDTSAANWSSPTTWINCDDAVFSNTVTASIITLSSGVFAGSAFVGNGGNNANYTFTGDSLSATTLSVQGEGSNSLGTAGYPITTLNDATVTVSGDMSVGRAQLVISGNSTVIAKRIGGGGIGGITSADWGQVTIQDNADVTAINGIVGGTTAWGLNLNGGTLTTKGIDYGPHSHFGTVNLNFNGTLVKANQDNANFITATGGLDFNPEIKAGGAKIDTNGYAIGIGVPLQGSGALTKSGSGTLVLASTNTYTGTTTVNAGTLQVGGSLSGPVTVAAAGTLAPGPSGGIGSLTLASPLTVAGKLSFRIDRSNSQNADLITAPSLALTGILVVNNIGPALQNGDSFKLFDISGSFTRSQMTFSLPALSSGLTWDFGNLPTTGILKVVLMSNIVGSPNWPDLLPTQLQAVRDAGYSSATINPGTYDMPDTGTASFQLDSWTNFTIDATGSIFTVGEQRAFVLKNCNNVTLRGAVIRPRNYPFTQGRVLAKGNDSDGVPYAVWRVSAGYPDTFDWWFNAVDRTTRKIDFETGDLFYNPADATYQSDGSWKLRFPGRTFLPFQINDWLVARSGGQDHAVLLEHSTNCTIESVTSQSGGFATFYEGGGGGNHLLSCRIEPSPVIPSGGTELPVVSCAADGVHTVNTYPGLHVENCVFTGVLLDDCIAIHGFYRHVLSAAGNTMIYDDIRGWGLGMFKVGDPVRISAGNGFFAQAICTAHEDLGGGNYRLTIDQTLSIPVGAYISNPKYNGDGFRIINSQLGGTRSRVIITKADNGTISGCTLQDAYSAVQIGTEYYWGESDYCWNVTVENNVINNCVTGVVVTADGAKGNKNIVIRNNTIGATTQFGISLEGCDGATVSGNSFATPTSAEAIRLENSTNIILANNLVAYAPVGKGVLSIGSDVTSVQGTANGVLYSGRPYGFSNALSGLSLAHPSSNAVGATLQQYSNSTASSRWILQPDGNGYCKIVSAASGLVVGVNQSTSSAAPLILETSGPGQGQRWTLAPVGTSTIKLVNQLSGFAATVQTAGLAESVTQLADTSAAGQLWTPAPEGLRVSGYSRWFDASQINSKVSGDPVIIWNDLSGNAAHATVPSGNSAPVYVANAGTESGLPAVYFAKNNGPGDSGALRFTRASAIRTVFSVFKGSSFLLTDAINYDFHRPGNDNPADPLWTTLWTNTRVRNGSNYVNGTLVNGDSFAMPTNLHNGFNLVEVLTTGNVRADSFNKDRSFNAGNQYMAEVIIYDRVLTETERLSVEDYLMKKWMSPRNIAPVATAQNLTTQEDTAKPITLAGTDLQGNPLTYTIVTQPVKGILSGTAPNVTYTPAGNYIGPDSFTFKVNGGLLNSAPATISITVTAVSDAPSFVNDPIDGTGATPSLAYSSTLAGSATDPDAGDKLTFTKKSGPAWLTIASDGTLSGTPANSHIGLNEFTVRVSDGGLFFDEATLRIPVLSDYQLWAGNYPGHNLTDPAGDADSDRLTNREEWIWGLDPTSGSSANTSLTIVDFEARSFRYTRRDDALTGLEYSIWHSTNLESWLKDQEAIQTSGIPDENGVETVVITLSPHLQVQPRLFLRVQASEVSGSQ
jgi:autotransporter-associated beta strand protein